MKKFKVSYFCEISKMSSSTTIYAENKTKAKKKFKDRYINQYPIKGVELIGEVEE